MLIPGVHAYAEESVEAGETIHFRASSTVPYDLSVVRLGLDVDDFSSDEVVHSFPRLEPKQQAIHPGSYIHVEKGPASREVAVGADARMLGAPLVLGS